MTDLIQKQALLLRKGDRMLETSREHVGSIEVLEVRDRDVYLSIRCRDGVLLDYFADEMVWTVAP